MAKKTAAKKANNKNSPLKKTSSITPPEPSNKTPIEHVVIIFKENHGFDNYFGTFPGADGETNLPHLPDPPLKDPQHTHEAWLRRTAHQINCCSVMFIVLSEYR